ncbi:MAG: peptide deformylase [Candidatus Hydrogenedentes bacterium]|nr:peptide deformylase [Candidatus Hydrogenedentota bacterium]
MSVLNVVLYPDDPLTRKAAPYEKIGPGVAKLAEDMLETMHAHDGVGLAGPQVGISKRIFVMQPPDGEALCLVNPEILKMEGGVEGEEGCLSIPRVYSDRVPRASWIEVKGFDETGSPVHFEAKDFLARIIQHEYDHLEGKFFFDRLDIISRDAVLAEWKTVRAELDSLDERVG